MLRVLDLFSGIGGFSLGLERTGGFQTVAFCEIDPFCRRVLAKHWPDVRQYEDVKTLTAGQLRADGISVDVICGGFPCQDISTAGKGAGIKGSRSGLWSEYARLVGELRPRFVLVENVAALLGRGLDVVLGDLAALGFDAEWHCIPASAVGAPHRRDRLWIVAHSDCGGTMGVGCDGNHNDCERHAATKIQERENVEPRSDATGDVANTSSKRRGETGRHSRGQAERTAERGEVAQPAGKRLEGTEQVRTEYNIGSQSCDGGGAADIPDAGSSGQSRPGQPIPPAIGQAIELVDGRVRDFWRVEPDVGRVANGVPARVDRLRSLGNAVVPQIPEMIGRAILATLA